MLFYSEGYKVLLVHTQSPSKWLKNNVYILQQKIGKKTFLLTMEYLVLEMKKIGEINDMLTKLNWLLDSEVY